MERYSARSIDQNGRFMLHNELRRKLCLTTGDTLSLKHIDTIIIMQRMTEESISGDILCEIDNLGIITLPSELRNNLGWKIEDKIALYHTDNIVILKKAN